MRPQEIQTPPNSSAQASRPSRLGKVKRGRAQTGRRFCFYGMEAVGKSTLAACAPDPIFIDIEDGTGHLDVARYTFRDGPDGHVPHSLGEVRAAIDDLIRAPHEFQTVVIDSLDRLEPLLWDYLLQRDSGTPSQLNQYGKKLDSIESYGFGKGYNVALDEWRALCAHLDRLRLQRGMNVILLGHTQIRLYKNPEGEDYDRFQLRIHDKAAGFIKEWCDVVGFCCYEEFGEKLSADDRRAKGASTGRRLMKLDRTAAYDAKTRLDIPAELELSPDDPWGPFAAAMREADDPKALRARISEALLALSDPELNKLVAVHVKKAGDDTAMLSRILHRLKDRQEQTEETAHV